MDYLEGLFLGTLWSDTDFENRRHYALFVLYGLFVDIFFLFRYLTGHSIIGIGDGGLWKNIILVILILACPFICFRYYRMPLACKLLVILEKVFKTYLVMDLTLRLVNPFVKVGADGLQDFLISFLNKTLEDYTMKFSANAGSFATVMGVLTGGIHVVLVCALVFALAVIIPGLVFLAVRYIQMGFDYIINQLIFKRYFPDRR